MKSRGPGFVNRRDFLISSAALAGGVLPMVAVASARPCPPPAVSATGGTSTSSTCPSDVGQLPHLLLTAWGASGTYAWTFGHAFRRGDVSPGRHLTADVGEFQADVRNRWPDGSVKFAVLSGVSAFRQGAASRIQISTVATSPVGSDLTTANLKATGVVASIAFADSNVTWSGGEWDRPERTVAVGKTMSSWIFRRQLGSDQHLVAWLEVRCYKNGAVEILPWIENGYLRVAGPASKTGRATFSINGAVRYDSINDENYTSTQTGNVPVVSSGVVTIPHHTRIVLVSGGKASHWDGPDPAITPAYDRAYLAGTRLIPTYRPDVISEATLNKIATTYKPASQSGVITAYSPMRTLLREGMGGTGYADDIGLVPNHSVLYLVSNDSRAYKHCIAAGLSLASYCIHYRDEATNRPMLFATYPQLTAQNGAGGIRTPVESGTRAYNYAMSHHPAAAYVPYLVTGWNWFCEEMQFQATAHYLSMSPNYRERAACKFDSSAGGDGMANQGGTRAAAWQWRTCLHAAALTPDSDTTLKNPGSSERNQFIDALNYNATRFRIEHQTGVNPGSYYTGDNRWASWAPNNLGLARSYTARVDGVKLLDGVWQDDFLTATIGWCWDLDVVSDSGRRADLLWFRDFKYRAVIGRLGRQNVTAEWNYQLGANYQIYYGVGTADPATFDWYDTWGEAFFAEKGQQNTGYAGTSLLPQPSGADPTAMSTGYWGNLHPAIAYAVDHGVSGALDAYRRMTNADNYPACAADFSNTPVWSVKPNSV